MSRFRGVTIRRVMDWMTVFIDTIYAPLAATGDCIAIADLLTLQFTAANTSVLSLHCPFPGNGF
jgi:hypothetical protein